MANEIKQIFIIEENEVKTYDYLRTSKGDVSYIYMKNGKDCDIKTISPRVFLSEIMALTTLEQNLRASLERLELRIKQKRNKFLGTGSMDSFKEFIVTISDKELEEELINITLEEVLSEEKNKKKYNGRKIRLF